MNKRRRRRSLLATSYTAALVLLALGPASAQAAKPGAGGKDGKRDVLILSNNWEGTADVIDAYTHERLELHQHHPRLRRARRRDPVRPARHLLLRQHQGAGRRGQRRTTRRAALVHARVRRVRPEADAPRRISVLPISAEGAATDRTDYTQDSAHHGLAMSPNGRYLCVAGTMSDYAAVVPTRTLRVRRTEPVGDKPYWTQTSEDSKKCFVSVSGDDSVAVLSLRTGREIDRIEVGDHPQRMRLGAIRESALR